MAQQSNAQDYATYTPVANEYEHPGNKPRPPTLRPIAHSSTPKPVAQPQSTAKPVANPTARVTPNPTPAPVTPETPAPVWRRSTRAPVPDPTWQATDAPNPFSRPETPAPTIRTKKPTAQITPKPRGSTKSPTKPNGGVGGPYMKLLLRTCPACFPRAGLGPDYNCVDACLSACSAGRRQRRQRR